MRTIIVVYTNVLLSKEQHQTMKRYSFNVSAPVKVGELLKAEKYDTAMQVVEVLPRLYKFVNPGTGQLSTGRRGDDANQVELRQLDIYRQPADAVFTKVITPSTNMVPANFNDIERRVIEMIRNGANVEVHSSPMCRPKISVGDRGY